MQGAHLGVLWGDGQPDRSRRLRGSHGAAHSNDHPGTTGGASMTSNEDSTHHPKETNVATVIACVDDSPRWGDAVELARTLADTLDASVIAASVYPTRAPL